VGLFANPVFLVNRESCHSLDVAVRRWSCWSSYIHMDLCGPVEPSYGGARYMATFTDDSTRYSGVRFLKLKSEVLLRLNKCLLCGRIRLGDR
jgi:hypothetical protein